MRRVICDCFLNMDAENRSLSAPLHAACQPMSNGVLHGKGDVAVICFCKVPIPGRTKTRLAKGMGSDSVAAHIYDLLARNAVARVHECSVSQLTCVFGSDEHESSSFERWIESFSLKDLANKPVCIQYQPHLDDLGRRMLFSLHQVLSTNEYALLIGTDIPDMSSEIIEKSVQILKSGQCDLVLGPAEDGGFYLIGTKRQRNVEFVEGIDFVEHLKDVFKGVVWSSAEVLKGTLEQARKLGIRVNATTLPVLCDIDTLEDLYRWLKVHRLKQNQCTLKLSCEIEKVLTDAGFK